MTITFFLAFQFISSQAQIPDNLIIWKFEAGGFYNAPTIEGSVAYCGSMDGNFYAINLHNGQKIWHYPASSEITSNAAIKENVVCFESGNKLYGLDKNTGKLLWEFVDREDAPTAGYSTGYHHSSPVIYKNVAYYGDEWGNLNGIDIDSGERCFHFKIYKKYRRKEDCCIRSTPTIKNDIIYFGDYGARVYAISLKDAKEVWSRPINSPLWDGSVVSDMVIKDNILYFGGYNNTFSPINIGTKQEVWSFTDPKTFLASTPVFYKDQVIMGSTIDSNKIYSFNAKTGKINWTVDTKGVFFVKPTFINDSVLIMNSFIPFKEATGMLYFINAKDGTVLNEISLPCATESSPVITDNKILLGRHDGLYLFDIPSFKK